MPGEDDTPTMDTNGAAASRRGRGRPRREGADAEILAATLSMLHEKGYRELTVDGVAERAGVAKTTIYRRWPTKGALVGAALIPASPARMVTPDTGNMERDVVTALRELAAFLRPVADGLQDGELTAALRVAVLPDVERLESILGRARLRHDAAFLSELLVAPLLQRQFTPAELEALATIILRGARR